MMKWSLIHPRRHLAYSLTLQNGLHVRYFPEDGIIENVRGVRIFRSEREIRDIIRAHLRHSIYSPSTVSIFSVENKENTK